MSNDKVNNTAPSASTRTTSRPHGRKEVQIPFDPSWMGFNHVLLHVPRQKLFADYTPDTVLVGLFPMDKDGSGNQPLGKFEIYYDRVEQQWGLLDRWYVITDNLAMLYQGTNTQHRMKLLRWERFLTDTGLDMWHNTGGDVWKNEIIAYRETDSPAVKLMPANWYGYLQQLSYSYFAAARRLNMGYRKTKITLAEEHRYAQEQPAGHKARMFYQYFMEGFAQAISAAQVLSLLDQLTQLAEHIAAQGRFHASDDPSVEMITRSF